MDRPDDITIGITCYREGPLLRACWDSVLAQRDGRFEIVAVLDGGCDPETARVFDSLADPRLRKIRLRENVGPYEARNRAFQETRSSWHYYVDADDLLAPDAISALRGTIAAHPEADVVYTDVLTWWPGKPKIHMRAAPAITPEALTSGFALFGASLIRKDVWSRVGGYAPPVNRTLGDLDFFIAAYEHGARFVHLGQPVYHYRRRPDSVSESYTDRYHEIYDTIIARHASFFSDPGLVAKFRSMGLIATARWHFGAAHFAEAERYAQEAAGLGRTDEARDLQRRIRRDRLWPKPLLRLRRRLSIAVTTSRSWHRLRGLLRRAR